MDILISILAIAAGLFGIIGSIVPGLPGPPVSWVGMLLLYFLGGTNGDGDRMSAGILILWAVLTILVTILDYVIPSAFTRTTGGSRHASRGSIVGLIIGCFFTPIGMILGAFLGAYFFERYWGHKENGPAMKAAGGAFLGFLTGTGIKLVASGIMMWLIIVYL